MQRNGLLNKRKHQQQEDDKVKRSFFLNNKESMKVSDKDGNNSGIPNQYARDKIHQKGRKKFKKTQTRTTITISLMNFLKKLSRIPVYMNLIKKQDMTYGPQNTTYMQVLVRTTLSFINL